MNANEGGLEWKNVPFSPYSDQGVYKCTATNRYKSKDIYTNLPEKRDGKQFFYFY